MFASRLALVLGLIAATLPFERAQAFSWELPHSEDHCDTGWVLQSLKTKVDGKYRKYNGTHMFLIDILNPKLNYERKRDEYHVTGRKFCHAGARMSDGRTRDLWYILETPGGFAGPPKLANLEFCIAGLDPWHIYGKDCSTIRDNLGW
jgi:hypothetical protein